MRILFVLISLFTLAACGPSGNERNVELIQDMMDQPSLKAQEADADSPNNRAMRVPPQGAVPRSGGLYRFATDPAGAESLKNPISGQFTEEILLQGRSHYETLCMVCHGITGAGDGTVAASMLVKPPSLHGRATEWSDGKIYHVIRMGQGVMGAYGAQVKGLSGGDEAIWEIVNYVRYLQRENKEPAKAD